MDKVQINKNQIWIDETRKESLTIRGFVDNQVIYTRQTPYGIGYEILETRSFEKIYTFKIQLTF